MAASPAYNTLVKISTNTIQFVSSADFSSELNMEDTSSFGNANEQTTPTLRKHGLKIKTFFDITDTNGQKALEDAHYANPPTLLNMSFSPLNGAANTNFAFSAYVAKLGTTAEVDGVVEREVELAITGTVTRS